MKETNSKGQCKKCGGKGYYQYSTEGTPHSKFCEFCCDHKGDPWKHDNGKFYCLKGCGAEIDHSSLPKQKLEKGLEKVAEQVGGALERLQDHPLPKEGWEKEFEVISGDGHIRTFIRREKAKSFQEGQQDEGQFILNILDGIDIADEQTGHNGGTKAIRFALANRFIGNSQPDKETLV